MDGRGRKHGTLRVVDPRTAVRAVATAMPLGVRRAGRLASRRLAGIMDGRVALPRRLGLALSLGLLGTTAAYAAVLSGELTRWADAGAAEVGYGIGEIRLVGAVETSEADVMASVGVADAESLLGIDTAAARAALLALPWIEAATVAKEYPHALHVTVEEREPVALWRLHGRTLILDRDGAPIIEADGRGLPLLVGEGADKAMDDGLRLLAFDPALAGEIKALVRIGSRRWNAVTHRNVVVKLPATSAELALGRLSDLHRDSRVLDKEIASIDLRVADRVAFGLTDEGAERRREFVAAQTEEREDTRELREVEL